MFAINRGRSTHRTWTSAVRYNRVDFAEICCTADNQLAGEIITRGGTADRYSHWNGFDLTTHRGATSLRNRLEETQPRWVWFSPPCGPDSPMQNLTQINDEQKARLETKRNRAHRIRRKIVVLVKWLMEAPWCEEVVLEQSSCCRSICQGGTFGELKHQCHGAFVPGSCPQRAGIW